MNAERDAQALLKSSWQQDGGITLPVDPFRIAQKMGVKAFIAGLDAGVSGLLIKRPGQDAEIYVHGSDSPNRQRFTCAHELGHYVKRSATGDDGWEYVERRDLISTAGTDQEEIYANQFAAALLMPKDEVIARFSEGVSAGTLAPEFGVSADAMHFRLVKLGLVSS
jgi:Zn-dependent peptidase ImmA (M78 family)